MGRGVVLLLMACAGGPADERLNGVLRRLAEEAEIFTQTATNLTGEETLQQKARKSPRRFRPRLGSQPAEPPKPEYQSREIVSEYGFAVLKEVPGVIHEFRQVVSVDGRRIKSREEARQRLVRGLSSADDRLKKRMLEQFQRYGLAEAATDFGQLLLLFGQRSQGDYQFRVTRAERLGADRAVVVEFEQRGGSGSLLIFQGKTAVHERLNGEIWAREGDWLPLRITLRSRRQVEKVLVRDEASVDYAMSPHGVLVPAAAVHRQWAGQDLLVENLFRYAAFRRFGAEVQVKY